MSGRLAGTSGVPFRSVTPHSALLPHFPHHAPAGGVAAAAAAAGVHSGGAATSSPLPPVGSAALQRLDDPAGEVAKNFRAPGHVGTVSFITSMTSHFCGECNRCVCGTPCCVVCVNKRSVLHCLVR
jgi:hypothetical protein